MTYDQPGISPDDQLRIPIAPLAAEWPRSSPLPPAESQQDVEHYLPDRMEQLRIPLSSPVETLESLVDEHLEPVASSETESVEEASAAVDINVEHNEGSVTGVANTFNTVRDLGVIELDEKAIRDRVKNDFVAPNGFGELLQDVAAATRSLMVLAADADHGRDLTAEALLCAREDLEFKGIGAMSKTDLTGDRLAWSPETAWLVDLTDADGFRADAGTYLRRLEALAPALVRQHSVLIAVVPRFEVPDDLVKTFSFVIDLHADALRLDRSALVCKRLDSHPPAVGNPSGWEAFTAAQRLLDDLPPAEAVRFAEVVREVSESWIRLTEPERAAHREKYRENPLFAKDAENPIGEDEWVVRQLVLEGFKSWDDVLTDWNTANEGDAELAAFQIAAAVLATEPVDEVIDESRLLRDPDYKESTELRPFEGRGARLLTKRAMARIVDDRVEFDLPGLDDAVLWYYWQDRRKERPQFVRWMVGCLSRRADRPEAAASLEKRIGDFAIQLASQHRDRSVLSSTIETLSADPATAKAAVRLLLRAAQHENVGREVRTEMLTWASSKSTELGLREAVATVCGDEAFMSAYPNHALVRIRHLVAHDDMAESEALLQACAMLTRDPKHANALISDLAKQIESPSKSIVDRNLRFFLETARVIDEEIGIPALQQHGLASPEHLHHTAKLWGSALRYRKPKDFGATIQLWLDGAVRTSGADDLTEMLRRSIIATEADWRTAPRNLIIAVDNWEEQTEADPVQAKRLAEQLTAMSDDFFNLDTKTDTRSNDAND
ncbi:hypothetical protein [Glycomyces buryatensis]|uniref:Uncharacterized protein n=1 Tax=Glycomyces buryatensis TaxID=2570927 RepID=A0A4S8QA82_9ACTN|nr:hypothetical protein [Glycomyces buryatensis]THV41170.1 hypothetical protein FAB82_13040 [Glycomyces buryatensis]